MLRCKELKSCLNPLEIGSNCNKHWEPKEGEWCLNPLEIGSNCNIKGLKMDALKKDVVSIPLKSGLIVIDADGDEKVKEVIVSIPLKSGLIVI